MGPGFFPRFFGPGRGLLPGPGPFSPASFGPGFFLGRALVIRRLSPGFYGHWPPLLLAKTAVALDGFAAVVVAH